MGIGKTWSQLGSMMASMMFVYTMFEKFFPRTLRSYIKRHVEKFTCHVSPYIQITFHEFSSSSGRRLKRSEAFAEIQTFLSGNSAQKAKRLKAEVLKNSQNP
ncbi:hypothetical protein RIF29_18907 [Crotalaria pallida]|uniref:AAA-type ATPase N-terminal domain-containing protein n=1 Tax=Crotalaria pallida TaxID=3830 RepID=A0AAN9F301_CROPI